MNARFTLHTLFAMSLSVLGLAATAQTPSPKSPLPEAAVSSKAVATYGHLPLSFQPNQGQTSKEVQWLARGSEYTLFLSGPDAVLEVNKITPAQRNSTDPAHMRPTIQSTAVRMNLLGAKAPVKESGEELQEGKANYFSGRDSAKWQRNVPLYGKVRMEKIYPGIDLVYYGTDGSLEYDFVVAAGADPSAIQMKFDGATPKLTSKGDLVLPVDGIEVRFDKPVLYQVKDGVRQPVDGSFTIADNKVSFNLGSYDKARDLVIDPTLVFAGTLGTGNQQTIANGMAVDAAGEIILTGITNDLTFPVTAGALQPSCTNESPVAAANGFKRCGASSASSGFVTKISADGTSLVYSTYLHGLSGGEYGQAVAVDSTGATDIIGGTSSNDFPITSDAFQSVCQPYYSNSTTISPACDGFFDGGGTEYTVQGPTIFLVKLSADGSTINYGTFFGGTDATFPTGIALDSSNNIYFASAIADARSAANVHPNNGNSSIQFPLTAGAYQSYGNDAPGVTLSKLSADGHTLLYSTLLSATSDGYNSQAVPQALAVGPNGIAYVSGFTDLTSFPITSGALKTSCDGNGTANCEGFFPFITAFDTTQSGSASLVYSTFLGGDSVPGSNIPEQEVLGLVADSSNNLYATGYTYATDFPVTPGVIRTVCDPNDNGARCDTAFVTKINPTGTQILWSTFLDGNGGYGENSTGNGLALDAKGRVYVYGNTNDPSFPQVNSLTSTNNGGYKLFFSVLSPDATALQFSTWLGQDTAANPISQYPSTSGGFALDSAGNIYFSGYSADNGNFVTTSGTYATTATSGFNRTFFGKISAVLTQSATAFNITPSPAVAGQSTTFTAVVTSPAQTTPVPTGTVVFTNTLTTPATELGTATLDGTGTATFSTTSLIAGTYSVTATYSGDTTYDPSNATASLTVNAAPALTATTTVLSASPTSITSGGTVTLISTTTGTGTVAPTGTVIFYNGTTSIGTGTLNGSGVATLAVTTLPVGSDSITSSYAGDANNAASVSAPVTVTVSSSSSMPTATATMLSASPTSIASGASVTLTSTTTGTGTVAPTGTVTFYNGTTSLGTGTLNGSGIATLAVTSLPVGSDSITSSYAGDANNAASVSAAVTVTVSAPAASFVLSLSSNSVLVSGAGTATDTVTITPSNSFSAATTFACSGLPANSTCSFSPSSVTPNGAAATTTLTVTTGVATKAASLEQLTRPGMLALGIASAMFFLPCLMDRKRRAAWLRMAMILVLATAAVQSMTGCGGGSKSSSQNTTPAGTSTVTVIATSGSLMQTTTFALTVQ